MVQCVYCDIVMVHVTQKVNF